MQDSDIIDSQIAIVMLLRISGVGSNFLLLTASCIKTQTPSNVPIPNALTVCVGRDRPPNDFSCPIALSPILQVAGDIN
ncbi:MAG: hypothetical protein MUE44_05695 [Oscillatoriaceae cyanobacterium Prado104]|jgi:hypothetical protein|nr:hypothetical protein [Oscillatoriaceae cyanobacterium Prado104]